MKTTFLSLVLAVAPWSVFAGNEAIENYVAHEWGTFTSLQGADGVLLPWHPLETAQLPKFVYDWNKPGLSRRPAGALSRDTKSVFVRLEPRSPSAGEGQLAAGRRNSGGRFRESLLRRPRNGRGVRAREVIRQCRTGNRAGKIPVLPRCRQLQNAAARHVQQRE